MILRVCILIGALMFRIPTACCSDEYELSNGYFQIYGSGGLFDVLRFDPAGKGKYGENLIISLTMCEIPSPDAGITVTRSGESLTLSGLRVRMPVKVSQDKHPHAHALKAVQGAGIKFIVPEGRMITSVSGKFPTWHTSDAVCTLSLYRLPAGDLARKELLLSRKVTGIADNSVQSLEFDPQPAGTYYFEVSEVSGTLGWWGSQKDENPDMTAYVDGKEVSIDFEIVWTGFSEITGDWTIKLDGPKLETSFTAADPKADTKDFFVRMVTPWEKSGYDVSKFPFSRFYTDTGRHMLIQQLKRRPHSGQLQSGKWIYAMGKKGYDLRFNMADGQRLAWAFEDQSMAWKFNGTSLNLELLKHNPKLPDYYPVFYSSDKKYARILTEFYYSHAINFGVGTPPDWKEWQALILDWTANPQVAEHKGHFTGVAQRPDGYVHTWGAQEGWPFPYKDDDKDGKNDFDTRHFTTNSCFILGAYRLFCWTRDVEFLKAVMPKVRKAMAFNLNDLKGRNGIIVIDAKGHEGRAEGIGSNYWDILPFGHKDAFCNSYYYESLRAMADLERYCEAAGLELDGPKESPTFYEALRPKVRRAYNREFWNEAAGRYVGCVDVDGVKHDYGFTFVNLEAMAYDLADKPQVERIYKWMETEKTSSGKADTYSRWIFAPRALTIHNPPRKPVNSEQSTVSSSPSTINHQPSTMPPWWHSGWGGTAYDDQCQTGGAILYTSGYDIIARAKYLGADNAWQRMKEILDRYNMPDRLMGGSPLYRGEATQGGPGGSAGSVGVEGEFPESGLVPASFLYAFLGIQADTRGLHIRPNLPSSLKYAGVRNLSYAGVLYDIKVTNDSVEITPLNVLNPTPIKQKLKPGETFTLGAGRIVN